MHRAAAAPVQAGRPAAQLGQHPARIGALGQHVPVPAVGAGDLVIRAQRGANADGDRLLPDVGVDAADDLTGLDQPKRALLELRGSAASSGTADRSRGGLGSWR